MKTLAYTVAALAASLTFVPHALARHDESVRHEMKKSLRAGIADQRQRTWYWQDKSGIARWPTRHLERHASLPYLHHIAKLWKQRYHEARHAFKRAVVVASSDMSAWLCIHSHEGAWNAATGNGFYGGLQMDMGFQQAYGSEFLARYGTANNWPPSVQIQVARRARDSGRGYGPWPNTARSCGLL